MTAQRGILAIFNNIAPGRGVEFEYWFQTEHLQERLAVPGFLLGRRYEAVDADRRYFNFYVTRDASILNSDAYRARLNDPTPATRLIMSEVFRDMNRTVAQQTLRCGRARGAVAVTVRFPDPPRPEELESALRRALNNAAVAGGEIWQATPRDNPELSEEERLRGGDQSFASCLIIETLRSADAEQLADQYKRQWPGAPVGIYRLLCEVASNEDL